ncbi:MAG: hypothetical protein B5M48_03115 [Candidatus Omnitrophica bacterium 4484_213]|nr:MAG: hypothetical protein B5M48_03115 [Candidatus Omnitrophica bacterium 4484_213]
MFLSSAPKFRRASLPAGSGSRPAPERFRARFARKERKNKRWKSALQISHPQPAYAKATGIIRDNFSIVLKRKLAGFGSRFAQHSKNLLRRFIFALWT